MTTIKYFSIHPFMKHTLGSIGYDLPANVLTPVIVPPKTVLKIPTGVTLMLDPFDIYYAEVYPRSGLSSKGIVAINGIIDKDYRNELMVTIHNTTDESFTINDGDRIAQLIVKKETEFTPVLIPPDEITPVSTRVGGFGSTGI